MTLPKLPPPKLIQDSKQLPGLVKKIRSQPRLAIDTESNSLFVYQEQVCLIQFSIPGTDYLIDPLAIPDLKDLAPLFDDPGIEKVFHGAEYDVMCLKRDFGFSFTNLFDTRIACRTLGLKQCSLRDNLAQAFNVELNKRYQRANWGKRPLTEEMLRYARMDTHYLLPLRDRLAKALREAGRLEEAREASEYLTAAEAHHNSFDPEGYWRISNAQDLTRRQRAIIKELYLYRDTQAQRYNRPHFKILRDRTLLAITRSSPKDLPSLQAIPGLTPGQIRRFGEGLLAAVRRGRLAPLPQKPRTKLVDNAYLARYDALHSWRKRVARKRKVESDIILPRNTLCKIARIAPRTPASLQKIMYPLEWRFQNYGEGILEVLRGTST
jgi:ribonuclease D